MISPKDLVDFQLEAFFGCMLPPKIKQAINQELDLGVWVDGYELAVKQGDLDNAESMELLDLLLTEHPSSKLDFQALSENMDSMLPQSVFAGVNWLVVDGTSFVVTDSLRLALFKGVDVVWCSGRLALEGIALLEIKNGCVLGLAWQGSWSFTPDEPFSIALPNGELVAGETLDC